MALQLGALRNALIAAKVPDDLADKASEEVAGYDNRISSLDTRLAVLTWMVGTVIGLVLLLFASNFALWSRLGDIAKAVASPH